MEDTFVNAPQALSQGKAPEPEAAQSFDELRLDVMIVRRELEKLTQAPDYTITLGEIKKGLHQVGAHLAAIEKHPALQMTPAIYQQLIAEDGRIAMRDAVHQLEQARRASEFTQRELAGMVGSAKRCDQQRTALLFAGAAALLVGVLLSPFAARALPFGLQTRVAAAVVGTDRWQAGAELMEASSPERWRTLEAAVLLWRSNHTTLTACAQAAEKAQKDQRCTIVVAVP